MNRLKQMAGALMLLAPLAACDGGTSPPPTGSVDPPTGSIEGTVTIEGTGADGVMVTLSNGRTTTTAGGGAYRFTGVEGGAYTVTISGYPPDANFHATQALATIVSANQVVQVNFSGSYIRTSNILGAVTVEGVGQSGLTLLLSGMSEDTTTTATYGVFAFTGLRAGTYTVEVSGYDSEAYSFSNTSQSATVGVGTAAELNFEGTYIRTSSILGSVTLDGTGLSGLTLLLSGMSEDTTTTASDGAFAFTGLRAGTYTVEVSGFDSEAYSFSNTSQSATVGMGASAELKFEGTHIRTASIRGTVMVGEAGLSGVQVLLKQGQVDIATAETDDAGSYEFENLQAGSYSVTISGFDARKYGFEITTLNASLDVGEIANLNFEGRALGAPSIQGAVTAWEAGQPGLTVAMSPPAVGDYSELVALMVSAQR